MAGKTDFEIEAKFDVADYGEITREAVKELAKRLQEKERAEVSSSAMARFANQTRVSVRGSSERGWEVLVRARPNWMRAHEYGAVSVGRPMLWFPVEGGGAFPGQRAKKYFKGFLFRPKGKNVLINKKTGKVAYIGIRQTTIRPSLNMRGVAEDEAAHFVEHLEQYRKSNA